MQMQGRDRDRERERARPRAERIADGDSGYEYYLGGYTSARAVIRAMLTSARARSFSRVTDARAVNRGWGGCGSSRL